MQVTIGVGWGWVGWGAEIYFKWIRGRFKINLSWIDLVVCSVILAWWQRFSTCVFSV